MEASQVNASKRLRERLGKVFLLLLSLGLVVAPFNVEVETKSVILVSKFRVQPPDCCEHLRENMVNFLVRGSGRKFWTFEVRLGDWGYYLFLLGVRDATSS